MRISGWSSDVFSSDLAPTRRPLAAHQRLENPVGELLALLPTLGGEIDTAFCYLGSTPKQAGGQAGTRAIEARKSAVWGKSRSGRVEHGGGRILKQQKHKQSNTPKHHNTQTDKS